MLYLVIIAFIGCARAVSNSYSCTTPGKIAAIGCWHDDAGFVTGLAFEDDYGVKSPAMCGTRGAPDKYMQLKPNEVITEIVACEGLAHGSGYSLVQFYTDGGDDMALECGFGLSDYDAAAARRQGDRYKYAGVSKGTLARFPKVPGRCSSASSGKEPRWVKEVQVAHHSRKWYSDAAFQGDNFTYADGLSYSKLGSVDPETGKQCADCGPSGWYYSHVVYPLAQLHASCSAENRVARLESACWNSQYRPAPRLAVLAATYELATDCERCGRCPEAPQADYLRSLAAHQVMQQVERLRIGAKVKAGLIECKPRLSSELQANTTLSVAVSVSVQRQEEKDDVMQALHKMLDSCGHNLCNCLPLGESCAAHDVQALRAEFLTNVPRGVLLDYPSLAFEQRYNATRDSLLAASASSAASQQAAAARTTVAAPA